MLALCFGGGDDWFCCFGWAGVVSRVFIFFSFSSRLADPFLSSFLKTLLNPWHPSPPLQDLHRRRGEHPAHVRERAGEVVGFEESRVEEEYGWRAGEGVDRERGLDGGVSFDDRFWLGRKREKGRGRKERKTT